MLKCWDKSPAKRSTFSEIVADLSSSLGTRAGYLDVGGITRKLKVPDQGSRLKLSSSSETVWQKPLASKSSLQNLYT